MFTSLNIVQDIILFINLHFEVCFKNVYKNVILRIQSNKVYNNINLACEEALIFKHSFQFPVTFSRSFFPFPADKM